MSDNQWGPPGQYPQQPPPGGQGPYQTGQYPQGQPVQGGYPPPPTYPPPPGQVPPPGPFAPQPWQPQYGAGMPPGPNQRPPQGLGWGAQPGGPQRPKKKGPAVAILLVVGGLVGAVILLSVISGFLKHNSSASDSPYAPTSDPSYSPTYDPTSYESPSTGPSQPTTSSQPTTTRPTATRPTAPRTTTKPPVKRGPTDYEMVSRNRLYSSGVMNSVGCTESRARPSTAAGATANYIQLRACLVRAWAPYVKRAGGTMRVPNLQPFTGTVQSPCGAMSDTGPPFYCGSNDTIYMNLSQDVGNYNRYTQSYSKVWARMWMLHQFAHEFGHHVQNLTGILAANADMRYEAPNQSAELEMTRRLELQASCFSDIFIGANRRTYPITGQSYVQWKWLIANTIDNGHDHGAPPIHNYWALRGFQTRNPAACNTFTAPSGRVR